MTTSSPLTTSTRPDGKRARRARYLAHGVVAAVVALSAGVAPLVNGGPVHAAGYDPATDGYSARATSLQVGADAWWTAGFTGQGVDVALIDTGVSPVAGLSTPGKLIHGPDLSLESQAPALTRLDTNGHGTFMAGLIAGKDANLTAPYALAPASVYRGIAPDARILSVKVGTADGGTDVSQVIAAINWVIQHKNDNGMNIRVLNLSYGTNTTQLAEIDPLSYAAERAWKSGIVVVAAAGNSTYEAEKGLANPAYNRYVIGVGGYDTNGTALPSDDYLGLYSAGIANGNQRGPDFVAVGSHVQGLRVPNSFVDATHPEGRLDNRYFRGSGTSEAAAITSGAVALVLQKYPSLTPDQVKRFLATNTLPALGDRDPDYWGTGRLSLYGLLTKTPPAYTQSFANASGTGSLELARGTDHLSRNGVVLSGEKDIFGRPFATGAAATLWNGGSWNGSTWSGNTWSGNTWSGNTWSGNTWSGNTWSGNTWSGNTWSGNTWSGNTWSGSSWSGNTWSGGSWAGGSWT